MGFEGAKLSSQFRPENKADEYNEDDNNDGGDKALLIHSTNHFLERARRSINRIIRSLECIASILDLLTLSDQASEDVGTLLLRLESDALAFLQASGAILEDCSAG